MATDKGRTKSLRQPLTTRANHKAGTQLYIDLTFSALLLSSWKGFSDRGKNADGVEDEA